jgi:hypothetical protein
VAHNDALIRTLTASCSERAVDQEVVEDANIIALAAHPLQMD